MRATATAGLRHGVTGIARMLVVLACAALLACALPVAPGAVGVRAAAMDMSESSESEEGASEDDAASASSDDEQLEQLGLAEKLYRLSGKTVESDDDCGSVTETLGALFPNLLSITTTPSVISTGLACSMEDVCAIDPCTCGKPDSWGHCACAGYEDTYPTVTVTSSDESVCRVVSALGRTWLVPVSAGTAHVDITAELVHYEAASTSFDVSVQPLGALDIALVIAAAVLLAALVAALFLLVRALVALVRRSVASHRRWRARGRELAAAHPLTWKAKLASERRAAGGRARNVTRNAAHPFLHDFAIALRSAAPVFAGGLALMAVLVPVSTSVIDSVSVFNVDYTHEQLKFQFYDQDLSFAVNAACVVYGAVLAIALQRFLLAKRATTAFLSVGLSRVKLFASRELAGIVCIVVAIALPFAVSLALNCAALGLYDGELAAFAYVTCGYIVVALAAFELASIATVCAGTLFEAVAFSCALLLGVTVALWGTGVLSELLLAGNAAGMTLYGSDTLVAPSYLSSLAWANPVLFFASSGAEHQYFEILHPVYYPTSGTWPLVVGWLVVCAVLMCAALALFCRRRGEQAEMAGKAPVLSVFSVAVFGLAAFAAAVWLAGAAGVAVALAAGAALFVLVSVALLFGPLRGRNGRAVTLGSVAGELAAMALVVAVLATGGLGYSSYIPSTDDVASVEVSYVGSPSYLTQGFSGTSSGASYYYTSYRTYTDASSVDIVRTLHGQLIATCSAARETDYDDFDATAVPYDIVIRYTLDDGSEVVRYYSQATVGELAAFLALDDDEHARELEVAVITGDASALSDDEAEALSDSPSYNAYQAGSVYVADGALNRILAVELEDEQRAELLAALASDVSSLSAAQRYFPECSVNAVLMFTLSPELDVSSFGYSFSNAVSYVTDEWTATMAWLEANGYTDALGTLDASVIESLTFQLDDPYASINDVTSPVSRYFMGYRSDTSGSFWVTQDYGELTTTDDAAEIAEVLPDLRLGCYMSGGYLVEAKLRGIEAYVYFYLPADSLPSYIGE